MKEIWKSVNGYPNYQISNCGNVIRMPHKRRKQTIFMKGMLSKFGYVRIPLTNNSKQKKILLHRLVAKAFLANPNNLPQVNHKDGNKQNNSVDNLEWCTASSNMKHAFKNKLKTMTKGEDCSWSKLTEKQVKKIRYLHITNKLNMRELADKYDLNKTTIWEIIHRKIWRHI